MIVHLIDGTYELFRHFYGLRRFTKGEDPTFGAVKGVLNTVLQMIETGATHIGVATDHVIESFRNELWHDYKTGYGIEPALWSQFWPLEEALAALGVAVWPMVELEADDALASAAYLAARDERVEKVCIWTPDKDLAQCVVGDRVVQVDRRSGKIRNADEVRAKFGVAPVHIPDYLALVGDSADGYPGIPGFGARSAARVINQHGSIEAFPDSVLKGQRANALLFKKLAVLRTDAPLFADIDELRWRGPTDYLAAYMDKIGETRVVQRVARIALLLAALLLPVTARAQDATDLFLVQLQEQSGTLKAGGAMRLTSRPGYDNQPSFLAGTTFVLYTAIDSAGQADIWRYDLASGATTPLTQTHPESEYSATLMPRGKRISVVRVERDSTQRLWSFALAGSDPRIVIENVKPVGYHAWIDERRVVVFVLGQPPTLQIVDTRSGKTERIAENVGRALQRVPGRDAVSFVQRDADSTRWIKVYDADTKATTPLLQTLPENEYHVWTPSGILITARASSLYQRAGAEWKLIGDIGVTGISRLAISADGRQLIVVGAQVQPPAPTGQNPSPMVDFTREHGRIENQPLPGERRAFDGPSARKVELFVPPGLQGDTVKLLIHFHGAGFVTEKAATHTRQIGATVQLGSGSGIYDRTFSNPLAFDSLLAAIRQAVGDALGRNVQLGAITLSGWSAGYGAIRAIMRDSAHFERVDRVVLLDGIHAGYVPERVPIASGGQIDSTNVMLFVRLARAAMAGRKQFLITHSEIFPGTFASTTETTQFVLDALGLKRQPVLAWGPLGMQQVSSVQSGRFAVLGFAGNTGPDHVDHLHGMYHFLAAAERL